MGQDSSRYKHKGWIRCSGLRSVVDFAICDNLTFGDETKEFLKLNDVMYSVPKLDFIRLDDLIFSDKLHKVCESLFKSGLAFWVMKDEDCFYLSSDYKNFDMARYMVFKCSTKIYLFIMFHMIAEIQKKILTEVSNKEKFERETAQIYLEIQKIIGI